MCGIARLAGFVQAMCSSTGAGGWRKHVGQKVGGFIRTMFLYKLREFVITL